MAKKGKYKKRKSVAETIITTFLAIALVSCTGLAIWTSLNGDAQTVGPLAFLTQASSDKTAPGKDANKANAEISDKRAVLPEEYDEAALRSSAARRAEERRKSLKERLSAFTPAPIPDETSAFLREASPSPKAKATPAPEATPVPAPEAAEPVEIKISAIGDITMGVEVMTGQRKFEKKADDNGLEYFFSGVREILEKDDLTIGNLEGPLSSSKSHRKGRQFIFRGKPEYATALALGSIEAVTIANNHAKDLLERGRADTKKALDDAGVTWFGYDDTAIYEVMGVKIGLIGLTEWDYSQKRICGAVKALRQKCDAVILYMHWGLERRLKPTQAQKRLGRAAIDAGADMVLGSHSHVVGGIELYKDRPIVYGLANFCFSGNTNPSDKDTFIFTQSFIIDKRAGTVAMGDTNIIPCSVSSSQSENDFKPTPLSDKRALKVLEKIRKASKGFENTLDFAKLTDEISQRE